ncbi:helix-turn-helix domain-containing protein [Phytohabitans suffuscus]|uniref:Transcriptional regulator n=1 Tax=Phytohabitans suffuscus TaxID=624315 RepID=A0A6F8YMS8_9ACTN|nr:helix-turn-helix transcriptional regulator [Phytohabitans suffuscus]BCB87410.1 transcriptional regulator [Phytohabitans suffuscus]
MTVGQLLRRWRQVRRLSQLELAIQAEVSTRHLSFVETGRAAPSREMLLRLADHLDVPLRDRNELLLAAGYAPAYPAAPLDSPELTAVRDAIRQILAGHEPYPAVVVDRAWRLVDANTSVAVLTEGVAPELLAPPLNVMRLTLHPDGMAPRVANLPQWRAHLLERMRRQLLTGDDELAALYDELRGYPGGEPGADVETPGPSSFAVPLRLRHRERELAFFSTTATFGTPLDITVAELAIESFFPADDDTRKYLQSL